MLVQEKIIQQSLENPNKIAVDDGEHQLSYKDLNLYSNQLANFLKEHQNTRSQRIGLLLDNSIEAIVGILSTIKADACYVPLMPSMPVNKHIEIIKDADISIILSTNDYLKQISSIKELKSELQFINLNLNSEKEEKDLYINSSQWIQSSSSLPISQNIDEDLIYILYTSGTTGKSKGVMLMHKNINAYLDWGIKTFNYTADDKVSGHPRITFDLSVMDIFASLSVGATYCPITKKGDYSFPGTFIENMGITVWFSVPSILGMLIKSEQLTTCNFEKLRLCLVCGEALSIDYANQWLKTLPNIPLYNLYGPTEATIACTYHQVTLKDCELKGVPIGKPTSETEIIILNPEDESICSENQIGKLMICGSQLCAGYNNLKELTQKLFTPNPHKKHNRLMYETGDLAYKDNEGIIHYVGRTDQQVQVNGYRVELTGIESTLSQYKNINEVSVVFDKEKEILVTAIALIEGKDEKTEKKSIFNYCKDNLAEYMIPKKILFFDVLPKNSNGKIDRKQVLELYKSK